MSQVVPGSTAPEHPDPVLCRAEIAHAMMAGSPIMAFQPILDLASGSVAGFEALARFPTLPGVGVEEVFASAARMGVGLRLEALAIRHALAVASTRPRGQFVSINVSPSTLVEPTWLDELEPDLVGVQIEITEHERLGDLAQVREVLVELRRRGARIAVDDVGEGHAGLKQVMAIGPDCLKIDRSLVQGVDQEPALAALLGAMVRFAARTGADVCAEGVETAAELTVLSDLDVTYGQGYFIGRPDRAFTTASRASVAVCAASMSRAVAVGNHGQTDDLVPVLMRVSSAQSLTELAEVLTDIAPAVGADNVELSYVDTDSTYVEAVVSAPERQGALPFQGTRFFLEDFPLTRSVLANDTAAQVVLGAPGADTAESRWMEQEDLGSLLMVPARSGDRVVGLFECRLRAARPWRRRQIRAARTVAAVAGPVLENLLRLEAAQPPSRIPQGEP